MQAFSDMDDAGFATFGEPATFMPAAGSPVAVTVVVNRGVTRGGPGDLGSRTGQTTARLRRSDVALPKEKDKIEIAGTTYELKVPELDELGILWMLDLRKAPTPPGP